MTIERTGPAAWAVHPGEILKEEFLKPAKVSQYALAKAIGVPSQAINDIVRRKRGVSPDMAARLGRFWNNSGEFWLNLQMAYDLHVINKRSKKNLEKIQPYRAA